MSKSEKKRKGAVALGYNTKDHSAPHVIDKGFGIQAERIIKTAEKNKILIKEDPDLFNAFTKLNPGDEIPVKLYVVVAELLAYVYKVNGTIKEKIYG
jgi:flagellar biosynthesis protein